MNDFASQYQLQNLERQNQANSRMGSGIGTGADMVVEGVAETGMFVAGRQTAPQSTNVYSGVAGDIAGSSSEVVNCATEAGGSIIGDIVAFIGECIAGVCDGL